MDSTTTSGLMKKRHPHKTNILLVNITRLGDMLQSTPTIAGMKLENPDCKVTVLVEKQFEEVCHSIPYIDHVVSVDLGMTVRSLAREAEGIVDAYEYVSELVEDLRSRNFDYCLNMSSSGYTAMLLRMLNIEQNGGWTADEEGYRVIESDWAKLFASSVFHQNRQFNALNLVDVFRCSADIEKHPPQLLINVQPEAKEYAERLIADANFSNTGPLIAVQAGASQQKRQWEPANFIRFVNELTSKHNARVVLTGTKKELSIIDPIKAGCDPKNVTVAAGRTSIPQLTALLSISDLLVTGDTGPMHISVAVGTPVVSMFLASAFGYETGPYSSGNIILQPVIGCGPCNPNKSCARTDCHEHIDPEFLAAITAMRLKEDFTSLPAGFADGNRILVYRTYFDQFGFYALQALNSSPLDVWNKYREAYRLMWLDDLGGYDVTPLQTTSARAGAKSFQILDPGIEGLQALIEKAEHGTQLINELTRLIQDSSAPPRALGEVNRALQDLDRGIEDLGFHQPALGPVSRMFMFAKENLSGSEPLSLASQMKDVYEGLGRRCKKLGNYYANL